MARSFVIVVTDDPGLQQKAREWGMSHNVTVHTYGSRQWTDGLENPGFRSQHYADGSGLRPGSHQTESGGKVLPFPNLAGGGDSKRVHTMDEIESEAIKSAIQEYKGNLTEAAKALGIGRATLYRKVKQYNIDPSAARGKTPKAA